ncbi:MAG TPA: helix-turn-helix transcriptional regulator [Rhizomicrobium sp.]
MANKRQTSKIDVVIGARLREIRKSKKLSQVDLADRVDLTFQQIQKYEKGANRIPVSRLYQMAGALGVGAEYFFADLPELRSAAESAENSRLQSFASTLEGQELIAAFSRISSWSVRKSLLDLIKALPEA